MLRKTIITIFAFSILIFCYFSFSEYSGSVLKFNSGSPDDTENSLDYWIDCVNTKDGYRVKYPKNWNIYHGIRAFGFGIGPIIESKNCNHHTVYFSPVASLDHIDQLTKAQYFSINVPGNPMHDSYDVMLQRLIDEKQYDEVKGVTLGKDPTILLVDNGRVEALIFCQYYDTHVQEYSSALFEVVAENIRLELLETFLSTIKFGENC